jgi:hypothetical protein
MQDLGETAALMSPLWAGKESYATVSGADRPDKGHGSALAPLSPAPHNTSEKPLASLLTAKKASH